MPTTGNLETVNETVNTWGHVFINSLQQAFSQIIALAPRALVLPVVLVATGVLGAGPLIAALMGGVSAVRPVRWGFLYADRLATVCYFVLGMITFTPALDQLPITFGLLAEVIGLAVGLGGREVVGGI